MSDEEPRFSVQPCGHAGQPSEYPDADGAGQCKHCADIMRHENGETVQYPIHAYFALKQYSAEGRRQIKEIAGYIQEFLDT